MPAITSGRRISKLTTVDAVSSTASGSYCYTSTQRTSNALQTLVNGGFVGY